MATSAGPTRAAGNTPVSITEVRTGRVGVCREGRCAGRSCIWELQAVVSRSSIFKGREASVGFYLCSGLERANPQILEYWGSVQHSSPSISQCRRHCESQTTPMDELGTRVAAWGEGGVSGCSWCVQPTLSPGVLADCRPRRGLLSQTVVQDRGSRTDTSATVFPETFAPQWNTPPSKLEHVFAF